MADVAGVAALRAQIAFAEKLKRFMELEAPRSVEGVPARPYSLWINRLAKDIEDAEWWLVMVSA